MHVWENKYKKKSHKTAISFNRMLKRIILSEVRMKINHLHDNKINAKPKLINNNKTSNVFLYWVCCVLFA